ncbi:MAG: sigma-70 family RNA polymerase sigma factor [Melioribacteraceae bacterium]|nr:sigma-70 family RNA polymerase sigma factor [Melioribacteraceae bacterium]
MNNSNLWASYKNNPSPELKKQIILNYVNLVHYVIHRTNLLNNGLLDRRDYFQFGIEGLSEAIDRFDPDYGTKFETYAIQRIRGKIYDELRKYTEKLEPVLEGEASTIFPTSNLSMNHSIGDDDGMQLYEMLPNDEEKPDAVLEKKDLKERLLELIKELNEKEKTVLSLYYYEDLNYKEIAQVLNITVSRVSQIHSRVLETLKQKLANYNA